MAGRFAAQKARGTGQQRHCHKTRQKQMGSRVGEQTKGWGAGTGHRRRLLAACSLHAALGCRDTKGAHGRGACGASQCPMSTLARSVMAASAGTSGGASDRSGVKAWEQLVQVDAVQHDQVAAAGQEGGQGDGRGRHGAQRQERSGHWHQHATGRAKQRHRAQVHRTCVRVRAAVGLDLGLKQHNGHARRARAPGTHAPLVGADVEGEAQLRAAHKRRVGAKHQQLAVHPLGVDEALQTTVANTSSYCNPG